MTRKGQGIRAPSSYSWSCVFHCCTPGYVPRWPLLLSSKYQVPRQQLHPPPVLSISLCLSQTAAVAAIGCPALERVRVRVTLALFEREINEREDKVEETGCTTGLSVSLSKPERGDKRRRRRTSVRGYFCCISLFLSFSLNLAPFFSLSLRSQPVCGGGGSGSRGGRVS